MEYSPAHPKRNLTGAGIAANNYYRIPIPPFRLKNTGKRKSYRFKCSTTFAEAIKRMHEGGSITELMQD